MKTVIFIDKQRRIWAMDEDLGYATLESFEGNMGSEIIGDTDYAVIYDESEVIKIGNHRIVPGDCLIMKSYYGFKGLDIEDVEKVREAFKKHTVKFEVGPFAVIGYELSDGGR